ncbi:MAG: hypothetical protein IJ914_04125 [Prevotella sp.]|nr:hypothetical protein [Prevotella sp.]
MATLTKAINRNLFDSILPTFGTPRVNIPTWDESQKMFICNQYESANGHRYYLGVRFCDRIIIVEKVGLYHNWTYIDGIELYAFNGQKMELIQKRDYDKAFHSEDFIRQEAEQMAIEYLTGVMKVQRTCVPVEQIGMQARELISGCYKSFLAPDFNTCLTQILPKLGQH